ncbi:hypothetical protein STSP2_03284 [Anaerohalosphaera lusitana]|uniref:Uncharacterized protein n=1 Tax=Anaerohalosphaera lusitana TaxID=1936003 RepID=A0A1U9NQ71_9BACT|nr:hypothetical protein [Anaerohalosphaera lusitana]AQT70082.1 hypothetical protein STSP2_03284 [Anaerohalosphaera lusitana]
MPTKRSDWRTEPMPDEHAVIPYSQRFTPAEHDKLKQGYMPRQQEDKWFIYLKDDTICFHRSWTGFCMYKVELTRQEDGSYTVSQAVVNRCRDQYTETDDAKDVQILATLVNSFLLHKGLPSPGETDALKGWSMFGRAITGDDEQLTE